MKPTDNYWKKRIRKEEKKAWDIANRSANWQEHFYKESYRRIEKEINALYAEIQSGRKPLDQLTRSELWRYKHYVSLQNLIVEESKTIGAKQIRLLDSTLEAVFKSVIGIDVNDKSGITVMDNMALKQLKETVWSGTHYSQRIWNNTNNLAIRTKEKLTDMIAIGKLPEEVKRELREEFNVSARVADRLIRTESSHIFNTASMGRYEEAGVEQVEILIEDDEHACEECLSYDGKVFDIDKAPVLPIHPNCRCCYIPVVERLTDKDLLSLVEEYEPQNLTEEKMDVKVQKEEKRDIQLDEIQQEAQERTKELQEIETLHLNSYNKSHRKHAIELLGDEFDTEKELWEAYEMIARDLLLADVDGLNIDGFVDNDILYKFDINKGRLATALKNNKIGSIYALGNKKYTPQQVWEYRKKRRKNNK